MSAAAPIPAIKVAGGGLARVTTLVVHQSGQPPVQRCGHVTQLDVAKRMAEVTFEDGSVEWIAGAHLQRRHPRPTAAAAPSPSPTGPPAHADGRVPAVKVGNGNARVGTLVELTERSLLTKKTRKGRVTKLGARHGIRSAEVTFHDGAVEWVEAVRLMRQYPQTPFWCAPAAGGATPVVEPTAEPPLAPESAREAAPQVAAADEEPADRHPVEEGAPCEPTAQAVAVEEAAPKPIPEAQAAGPATVEECIEEELPSGSPEPASAASVVEEEAGPEPPRPVDSKMTTGTEVLAC
uniref:Uncharacterized protein n=1 Tax=Eutreptiella gymnastica TaxID=73025 RepID=A0A7S1NAE6_9EUGL